MSMIDNELLKPPVSLREVKKWAEFGHPWALIEMGYRLGFGKRVKSEEDPHQSFEFWRRAAEIGVPEAQLLTGASYDFGFGTRKHALKAMQWYMKAAWQEDPEAAYFVGLGYRDGTGFKRNVPISSLQPQAGYWIYCAAMDGCPYAQNELGILYLKGEGNFRKDAKEAVAWFKKAVAREVPQAVENLARCYWNGVGVRKDRRKADALFAKVFEAFESLSVIQPRSLNDLVIRGEDFSPVVRKTLCVIKAGELKKHLDWLRREVELGLKASANGNSEVIEDPEHFLEEIKREGRKRLAAERGKAHKAS